MLKSLGRTWPDRLIHKYGCCLDCKPPTGTNLLQKAVRKPICEPYSCLIEIGASSWNQVGK